MTSHNSSTTPQQMEALLSKYGQQIRTEQWTRGRIQRETGLGESASRRLLTLALGGHTGRTLSNVRALRQGTAAAPAPEQKTVSIETKGDTQTVNVPMTPIRDPDELIKQLGIDLKVWEVEKAVVAKWDMGSVPRTVGSSKEGWARESTTPQVTPLYSVRVYLKRRKDVATLQQYREDILQEIRETAKATGINRTKPLPKRSAEAQLLYLGAHDVHVGKSASQQETLQDYSLPLARGLALDGVQRLLHEAAHCDIGRIVLPVGHDLAHFESGNYTTTGGTPQDPAERYRIMRRYAYELMVDLIQEVVQVAPVTVIGIPGNHGRDTDLAIAERLEARFYDHPNVEVQVPLTPRSYFVYGTNLLGLTHGDRIKAATLPLIMADEMPEAWSKTTHREWLLGHLHAKQTYQYMQSESEHRSVRVRILPSISAQDYYHAVCGYSNIRAMEAYRYHPTDGYAGHHSVIPKATA